MMTKKLCVICKTRPATVPDRNRPGRPINRLCSECHATRLQEDFVKLCKKEGE